MELRKLEKNERIQYEDERSIHKLNEWKAECNS